VPCNVMYMKITTERVSLKFLGLAKHSFPIFASHLQAIVGRSALGQSLACCARGFAHAGRLNLTQIWARLAWLIPQGEPFVLFREPLG
jgi:hypothetical protein